MNENYLVLDGKRIDLTEEQIKTLGLDKKDYFSGNTKDAYFITSTGNISTYANKNWCGDWLNEMRDCGNFCTNKELLEQRALHETLNRLLWRFSMQNDGDKITWNNLDSTKYRITYNHDSQNFEVDNNQFLHIEGVIYFHSQNIARRAIKEVIEPFIKKHPKFKW